jgi:hypothetical protein
LNLNEGTVNVALTKEDAKVAAALVVFVLGGNASGIINAVSPGVRADPFTGTDAKELRSDLESKMARERVILKAEILATVAESRYKDERECERDKQAIRERISVIEQNQEHCLRMIRQHDNVLKDRQ